MDCFASLAMNPRVIQSPRERSLYLRYMGAESYGLVLRSPHEELNMELDAA